VVSATGEPLFKLEELDSQRMYFKTLRKPAFQRQTADWSPEMIVGLVKSFLRRRGHPCAYFVAFQEVGENFCETGQIDSARLSLG
jgi:hypothetical protein